MKPFVVQGTDDLPSNKPASERSNAETPEEMVERYNKAFVHVLVDFDHKVLRLDDLKLINAGAFGQLYNEPITVVDSKGQSKTKPAGRVWLDTPGHRTAAYGLVFDPEQAAGLIGIDGDTQGHVFNIGPREVDATLARWLCANVRLSTAQRAEMVRIIMDSTRRIGGGGTG